MTQFNLADELRRRGTEYACLGCCRQFAEGDESMFPEWQHERCGGLVRKFASPFAAAVPAGNQAKAPTALDEMRALQEGVGRDGAWHILKQVAGESTADRDLIERLQSQLSESREALARVEAGRDTSFSEQENVITRTTERLEAAEAELRKRDAVIEAARTVVEWYESLDIGVAASAEVAILTLGMRLSALDQAASEAHWGNDGHIEPELGDFDQAASEAEVTERAIVVGSKWTRQVSATETVRINEIDERHVHFSIEGGNCGMATKLWFFTYYSPDPEATESAPREG